MKLYHIHDHSGYAENGYWFTNKRDAVKFAKEQAAEFMKGDPDIEVRCEDIGKIDKAKIVLLLEHHSFVESSVVVASVKCTG